MNGEVKGPEDGHPKKRVANSVHGPDGGGNRGVQAAAATSGAEWWSALWAGVLMGCGMILAGWGTWTPRNSEVFLLLPECPEHVHRTTTQGGPLLSKRDAPVVRYTPDVMRAQFKGLETIDSFFRHAVKKYGDRPCFGTRVCKNHKYEIVDGKRMIKYELGDYRWKTFKEADAAVEALARGLTTLGLLPYSRLVIFAETREEWMLVALACFRRAIVVCTIYATLGDDGLVHGVNETEVKTIITTEELLPRLVNLMPRLPAVTHVVCMPARGTTEPPPPMNSATVLPLESLMNANPTEGPPLYLS
ncbi:hypothetical protein HPB51_029717 [Rhipicephalus microplus]|uniref:long-chain-fatty-acid--CoA ligase n=1 Tax=Rhipicephalus microplus TaxID=6941 RepID=A0A9J6CU10_RHIMP|nr:hypothetical protein HPB51_029717 [Rhipicephalus microplus]